MKIYNFGNNAIMFGDKKSCVYCAKQDLILRKKFKKGHYLYKKVKIGKHLKVGKTSVKIDAIPMWYIPTGNGKGYLKTGLIDGKGKIKLNDLLEKRRSGFGNAIPEINTLAKYGKNFPDNKPFQVTDNFNTQVTKTWGNPLLSGTLGREFGPGNTDKIYSNNYFNDIRMARPGGDLDTTLSLNQKCNVSDQVPSASGNVNPITYTKGMIYDSANPQITSFGKKRLTRENKKIILEIITYKHYINNESFKKGILVRCGGNAPNPNLGGLSCNQFNQYSTNYEKLVPVWKEKIKELEQQLKMKNSSFGNSLYQQIGQTPLSKNTLLIDTTAGARQNEQPRAFKGSNNNLFINSSEVYKPVKSESFGTSFGKSKTLQRSSYGGTCTSFGKLKKIKNKPGPGKTLIIKGGRIKVKG